MSQLIDNLNIIESIKTDIKAAIENKGVDMTGVSFPGYAGKIGEITTSFVTVPLNVSANGTYNPSEGIDGYSQVVVDVPQSVTGYTEKEITESINIVNLNNSASFVRGNAFAENYTLQTVNLQSCEVVYNSAFLGCQHLYKITLPICSLIGTNAFYACYALKSIELPECKAINAYAFQQCTALSFVSLTKCNDIDYGAFDNCNALYDIYLLSDNVVNLTSEDAFYNTPIQNGSGSIFVPYSLVDSYKVAPNWNYYINKIFPLLDEFEFINGLIVGSASTMDSRYLDILSISADEVISVSMYNVESLESSTFMNYPNLVSISFPKLTYYGDDTFAGCTSLSEVTIKLPSLGNRVFAGCTSLKTVDVNFKGLVTIGSDVFSGCTALTSIYVNEDYYSNYLSAQNWSNYSSLIVSATPELEFKNGLVYGSASSINNNFLNILGITSDQVTSVSLPNCLYLATNTFINCQNLLTVDIPECSYIGVGAFSECARLSSINLEKCEYIGSQAFQGAFLSNGLNTSIVLPVCSYIGQSAFFYALTLTTITLKSNSVCSLGYYAFDTTNLTSIYVPASLVDAYKSAENWSYNSNRIFPIE